MKKILSMILALTMIFSLSITAFAADLNTDEYTGNLTGNVNATYTATAEATSAGNIYAVSIEWTNIGTLVYSGGSEGTYRWNPTSLKYELDENSAEAAGWTDASVTITVKNSSNASITATAEYKDNNTGATTSMKDWTDNKCSVTCTSAAVNNGTTIEINDTTTQGAIVSGTISGTVTATGTISKNTDSVGTITITLTHD